MEAVGGKEREQGAGGTPIKVLCLGTSGAKLWAERADARVAGAVDLYEEAGRGMDSGETFALFADTRTALREVRPDLVYMTIPPWAKTDMGAVREVIDAGYDLYLDKLRPADWREADTLLQWARESGRQIGIGEAYRFDGRIARIKQLIAGGELGKIATIVWQCYRPMINAFWMKAFRHVMLEDLSYHHFGVMHELFGLDPLQRVYAQSVRADWAPEQPPCVVALQASGDDGLLLHYYATWAAKGRGGSLLGQFRIEGSEGMIELTDDRVFHADKTGVVRELQPVAPFPHELRSGIIDECARAVKEKRATTLDIRRVHPYLRFIGAALTSVARGEAVPIVGPAEVRE